MASNGINLANWLLDAIFPIRCVQCGDFGTVYLCASCLKAVPIRKNFECIGCKIPTPMGITCIPCARTNAVDQLLIATDYQAPVVQKILKTYKYRFTSSLAVQLAAVMNKYLHRSAKETGLDLFAQSPLLAPVPLHRRRRNWRGFDQASILTAKLAAGFLMPLDQGLLERTKMTTPQAQLGERGDRLENVKGIFKTGPGRIAVGKTIILVDDVCTSGATLNECARVLKENGAKKIIALVFARG